MLEHDTSSHAKTRSARMPSIVAKCAQRGAGALDVLGGLADR